MTAPPPAADDRQFAEQVVDATHPTLARVPRWSRTVPRAATAGAVGAVLAGIVLAPAALRGLEGLLFVSYLAAAVGLLWLVAWLAGRTAAEARRHLVATVLTEVGLHGRAAAVATAARLGPLGPAQAAPAPRGRTSARTLRRGPGGAERRRVAAEAAESAGRRALVAQLALASLGSAPETPDVLREEVGAAG